jgi:hypothetical protein
MGRCWSFLRYKCESLSSLFQHISTTARNNHSRKWSPRTRCTKQASGRKKRVKGSYAESIRSGGNHSGEPAGRLTPFSSVTNIATISIVLRQVFHTEGRTISTLREVGYKEQDAVLCVISRPSCPVPRSMRWTGVHDTLLSMRCQLSVLRGASEKQRRQFVIARRDFSISPCKQRR